MFLWFDFELTKDKINIFLLKKIEGIERLFIPFWLEKNCSFEIHLLARCYEMNVGIFLRHKNCLCTYTILNQLPALIYLRNNLTEASKFFVFYRFYIKIHTQNKKKFHIIWLDDLLFILPIQPILIMRYISGKGYGTYIEGNHRIQRGNLIKLTITEFICYN